MTYLTRIYGDKLEETRATIMVSAGVMMVGLHALLLYGLVCLVAGWDISHAVVFLGEILVGLAIGYVALAQLLITGAND